MFIRDVQLGWDEIDANVKRTIIAFCDNLMVVKVVFEKGGIGSLHKHYHSQITYIESGVFEVEVDGKKEILHAGDSFFATSNVMHGVVCLEKGVLIDSFSPAREDFLV
ncbi:MAG: cupin domain-containing protein [Bacteroidota bacterium]|jgi:quercetin dioxygenase-like cupin family protein